VQLEAKVWRGYPPPRVPAWLVLGYYLLPLTVAPDPTLGRLPPAVWVVAFSALISVIREISGGKVRRGVAVSDHARSLGSFFTFGSRSGGVVFVGSYGFAILSFLWFENGAGAEAS
jgi:hypothetical protein